MQGNNYVILRSLKDNYHHLQPPQQVAHQLLPQASHHQKTAISVWTKRACSEVPGFGLLERRYVWNVASLERKELRLIAIKRKTQVFSLPSTRITNHVPPQSFPSMGWALGQVTPLLSRSKSLFCRFGAWHTELSACSMTHNRPKSFLSVF